MTAGFLKGSQKHRFYLGDPVEVRRPTAALNGSIVIVCQISERESDSRVSQGITKMC